MQNLLISLPLLFLPTRSFSLLVPHQKFVNVVSVQKSSTLIISSALSDDQQEVMKKAWFIEGPPLETKPDYSNIEGPLGKFIDNLLLRYFRSKMVEKIGIDSKLPQDDFGGIMELTAALNARYSDRRKVQRISQEILSSLFPSWLPGSYAILFSKPFPKFSSRMNAAATYAGGTWLMGECEVNDCETDDGTIGINQGLLVKRCRYLEESKCASACVNSCKIPTQKFFMEEMGLPLTMEPNYETGECQFKFGKSPDSQEEFDAKNTPCFSRCPSSGTLRTWHSKSSEVASTQQQCGLME